MKFNLVEAFVRLLSAAKTQGMDIQPGTSEPIKFDSSKGSRKLHRRVREEFEDLVEKRSEAVGVSRRAFLQSSLGLSAAAAAVASGLGMTLWPSEVSAAPGAGPYAFLDVGNPIVPDQNLSESDYLSYEELHGSMGQNQKVALVIGGSTGMGEQAALRLVDRGFHVIGTSRHPNDYNPQGYDLWELELTRRGSIESFVQRVKHEFGSVDLILANAGRLFLGRPLQSSRKSMRELMETNVDGHITLLQKLIPLMPDGADDYARVIFTSSVAGEGYLSPPLPDFLPVGGLNLNALLSPYAEAKARLTRFALLLAKDQANPLIPLAGPLGIAEDRSNLKVSVIHPSFVATGLAENPDKIIYGEDRDSPLMQLATSIVSDETFGIVKEYAGTAFEQMAVIREDPYVHTILADTRLAPGPFLDMQLSFLAAIAYTQAQTVRAY